MPNQPMAKGYRPPNISAKASAPTGTTVTQQTRLHVGPLPAPEDLANYDRLLPGAALKIIAMAEVEQRHRVSMEQAALVSDQRHREQLTAHQRANAAAVFRGDMLGQFLGWLVAAGCVGGAIFTVHAGGAWQVAMAFVSLPVIGIINAVRTSGHSQGTTKKP